jgi:predicted amidohydrolase
MAGQDYFCVGAIQPEVHYCETREEILEKNLKRHLELLDFMVPYWSGVNGAPCRLVVFPEFALHGIPQNPDFTWNGLAIDIPGEETEMLGKKAKQLNVFIASHAWTEYPDFPGRPFSVGFLVAPDGNVILKHHKTVTTKVVEAGDTAPGDAYGWFVEKFGDGLDAFFPVAETELGKMGFQICGEGQYGETSRGLAMNGAEIILRPNAWMEPFMDEPQDLMSVATRFAAFSNMCYVVESNWSFYHAPGFPRGAGAGRSQIVDYNARVLARSYESCETGVCAELNMESLRQFRENVAFGGRMTYMPNFIFRKVYESEIWPKNTLMEKEESKGAMEWEGIRREVIESRRDIYTRSKGSE